MSKSQKKTSSGKGSKASPKGSGSTKQAKTTNFGLGSRNITIAAKNALSRAGKSYSSIATISQRFSHFAAFAKETSNIKLMEQVSRDTVLEYAKSLAEKVEAGQLSAATAQNYLSAVNVVLALARGDYNLRVTAVGDAGLASRSGIAKEDKSVSIADHLAAVGKASAVVGLMLELQRELGLRFEESVKIDAVKAYAQAVEKGIVTIQAGTKGGRVREVPITSNSQIVALKAAAEYQGYHKIRSMIGTGQTYKDFRHAAYNEVRGLGIHFHGERHTYAISRYQMLVGAAPPVVVGIRKPAEHIGYIAKTLGISVKDAGSLDYGARLKISFELGHSRTAVTRAYLG
jgi:integrase